ncbi:biopolymer transporter ExbD [Flavobacterium sp. ov086]|uniref:ExbD/TolR family protein n=1 Tax=Flavobacterium sp. ov086 TaxID=1761785 RepID=UPI000B6E4A7F|nr:biopolymer transporter ExbD [Flavobacterium sp. ov086]SNR96043.1 Biopolymer transport protein ExbD [Flavobacterium sp. ov086]
MENLPKKVRSKKLSTRVDLTAMVSVSFLLIIFFMVTIELAKPKAMELDFPDHGCCDCIPRYAEENRSVTILLDKNDKITYFIGLLENPVKKPEKIAYGKEGIHKELLKYNNAVLDYSKKHGIKNERGITVIIKPSKKSNYSNLVEILDEMKITGIKSYAIVDYYTPEEEKLLAIK